MRFNINGKVRVKLTDLGRAILQAQHDELRATYPSIGKYRPAETDADGWSEFQMHDLMFTFGDHLVMGCPLPFETVIDIPSSSLTEA